MKNFITVALILFILPVFAQVGINTTSPTKEVDIDGGLRVRELTNTKSLTLPVHSLPDGTLVNVAIDNDAPGLRFIGFLGSNLDLDQDQTFYDINLNQELVDLFDEYDTSTSLYKPVSNGTYKIEMDFDIGGFTGTSTDLDILIGMWDNTDNRWVLRRTFKHRDIQSDEFASARQESYGIANYLDLDSTHVYRFRIIGTYDSSVSSSDYDGILLRSNTGGTGSSVSTSFSIEKVK